MKVCIDTRKIEPGDYFIPIKGAHYDGHDFTHEAIQKGGRVLDVDLTSYAKRYRKKLTCPIIAITGSAGKTTTKDLLASILSQKFKVAKTHENENNEIGVPLTLLQTEFDDDVLIVEMGMRHAGEIRALTSIVRPTHVIITCIGLSHIELLGSQKKIAQVKSEIFQKKLLWETQPRYAFLPYSSPFYPFLNKKAQKLGYTSLPFDGPTKIDQSVNLCYSVARNFGLTDEEIRQGITSFQSSSHRLKITTASTLTVIDDSYNANPDGVVFALEYIKRFSGRKILILGDMLELGTQSKEAHQNLLESVLDADISLWITCGYWGQFIACSSPTHLHFSTKDALHAYLRSELKKDDVILVKGSRGTKMEETVAFIQHHTT